MMQESLFGRGGQGKVQPMRGPLPAPVEFLYEQYLHVKSLLLSTGKSVCVGRFSHEDGVDHSKIRGCVCGIRYAGYATLAACRHKPQAYDIRRNACDCARAEMYQGAVCEERVRYMVKGKRVTEKRACAHVAAGGVVCVVQELRGGGCGMSVSVFACVHIYAVFKRVHVRACGDQEEKVWHEPWCVVRGVHVAPCACNHTRAFIYVLCTHVFMLCRNSGAAF
jgi:hypothetical protein